MSLSFLMPTMAGLLFVLAFFEVGVFCWPYGDFNQMLHRRKRSGRPPG